MKMRTQFAISLAGLSLLLAGSALVASGQQLNAPHAFGTPPPTVQRNTPSEPSTNPPPAGASWTTLTHAPAVCVGSMLLLTDGRVLVHSEPNGCSPGDFHTWYTLTPDNTGSYANGTWAEVAQLVSNYAPLFFGSAVLPDGRVIIEGGEYDCSSGTCEDAHVTGGAIYNPTTNTWNTVTPPASWTTIGDAQSVVLPNGTYMQANCCSSQWANFNGTTALVDNTGTGKADDNNEEGWNLLPNGKVLTVDAYVGSFTTANCASGGCNSELYDPGSNSWSGAGSTQVQLWDSNCSGSSGAASYEVGPAVLMPNGTVFYTGSSNCRAGNIATYNWSTGTWTAQSAFPNSDAANDAPASIEINGNAIVMASPFSGTFSSPSNFYEWNGTTLSSLVNPTKASSDASFQGHLLVLPTGQIMFTDFSTTVELLNSAGTFNSAWQPTITSVPSVLNPGMTYSVSGTQLNGVSTGAAYGDDYQDITNYPLVRIVNNGTTHVFYAKTHAFSTMGVGTGATVVSASFDVPAGIELGPCELYVVTNGIPSAASSCDVEEPTTTTLTSSTNPSTGGQTVTFTATVTPAPTGATGLGTVKFTANGVTIGTIGLLTADVGVAKLNYSNLKPSGTAYSIVATYSGTSDLAASTSNTVMQTVNVEPTSTTLMASNTTPTWGQMVMLTATVSSTNMGTPTGDVIFKNGTASIGTVALVKSGTGMAQAVLNISTLPVAMNSITADYTGSTLMQTSTSTATTVTVSQATSTTTLTSSANPSVYGQTVSFTVTVSPANGGTPTGTVTFFKNGVSVGTLDLSGGKATLPVTSLTPATYMITATYNGSTNVAGSTTAMAFSQVVNKASTTTAVMSSNLMVTHGTPVTFTATVTAAAPSTAVPTGAVMFTYTVNGHSQEMGVGTLSGGQAMLTYTFATAGSYSITATYTGSAYVNASPASPAITETVN